MQINWYPGHMAKAKRLLQEQLARVDAVIELCDARLPRASRNPDLSRMLQNKQRVLLLNKADLADPAATRAWLAYFTSHGVACAPVTATRDVKSVLPRIEEMTRGAVERAQARGIRKTVRVMVAGVPNVGKSTLINRLQGGAKAKTGDKPGVTRANQWVRVTPYLEIMDTPGLLWPRLDDAAAARRLTYIAAIRDEVVDLYALSRALLEEIAVIAPGALCARYKIEREDKRGDQLLEDICRARGYLMRGGEMDIDRACAAVLDEFRDGKLGRITLERADG